MIGVMWMSHSREPDMVWTIQHLVVPRNPEKSWEGFSGTIGTADGMGKPCSCWGMVSRKCLLWDGSWKPLVAQEWGCGNHLESIQYEETIASSRNGVREPFIAGWFQKLLELPGRVFRNHVESVQYGETIASSKNGVREPLFSRWFTETLGSPWKTFREPFREFTVWRNHCLVKEWCEGTIFVAMVPQNS